MSNRFDKDIDEDLLDDDGPEHTSVTMKLAIIQQRCADLLDDDDKDADEFGGLSLADEEPEPAKDEPDPYDPYGR